MTDHQVLPSEPLARQLPASSDVAALRRLLSSAAFDAKPAAPRAADNRPTGFHWADARPAEFRYAEFRYADDEVAEEPVEEDGAGGAPHCRHATYYVD